MSQAKKRPILFIPGMVRAYLAGHRQKKVLTINGVQLLWEPEMEQGEC